MSAFARLSFGLFLLGAVLAAPPAGAQSQAEMVYLQDRIARLEAQTTSLMQGGGGAVLAPQSEAQLSLRIQKLEDRVQALTGQVEGANYRINELREQVRRFQEDAEFRFRGLQGDMTLRNPIPMSGAERLRGEPVPGPEPRILGLTVGRLTEGLARSLSSDQPSVPAEEAPAVGLPLDLSALVHDPNAVIPLDPNSSQAAEPGLSPDGSVALPPSEMAAPTFEGAGTRPGELQPGASPASGAPAASHGDVLASLPDDPFDAAYGLYLARDYSGAASAFVAFIDGNPDDPRVGAAKFWIGESFAARGQHREAAEVFFDVYTEHRESKKAPESLLRLATSLDAIGKHEAACTIIDEFRDKFPAASTELRDKAAAEASRLTC